MERVKIKTTKPFLADKPLPGSHVKPFAKHHEKKGGREKGTVNKTTKILKEALILAAEAEGFDGRGKEGLMGFLRQCAKREKVAFMRMLEKILPYQITGKDGGPVQMEYTSRDEIAQRMRERGLPVPESLMSQGTETRQ
jgi:hypothetical protein